MLYNYNSARIDSPEGFKRMLRVFFKTDKYWGLFSFQPDTLTCIEKDDLKVLQKYDPHGLVLFKNENMFGENNIVIPSEIMHIYYDIYREAFLDKIKDKLKKVGNEYFMDIPEFKRRVGVY